jgi:DNA-directed RNA polymerase I subunit RPA1
MLELAEAATASTLVRSVKGIDKVFVIAGSAADTAPAIQTDGLNFEAAWQHPDTVDVSAISCNDVAAMMSVYGVEAARATLVAEVRSVFAVYGIQVDARHLSLIGDFMTQAGGYRACNRIGIASNASPLLKMSFETSVTFLKDAALRGSLDCLSSAAAQIVLGQPVGLGTGAVSLRMDLESSAMRYV